MQRAGKPVHVNDILTHGTDALLPTKYFIPRRQTRRLLTDAGSDGVPPYTNQTHTGDRTQDLFGPNWNKGGDAISPNTTTVGPTVTSTTDVTWNDGGGQIDGDGTITGNAGPGARSKSFTIRNTGTVTQDTIRVSFDSGANYFTLEPGESYSGELSIYYFLVKRVGADNGATSNPTQQDGVFEALAVLA